MKQFEYDIYDIVEKIEELEDLMSSLKDRVEHEIAASRYPERETELTSLNMRLDDSISELTNMSLSIGILCVESSL